MKTNDINPLIQHLNIIKLRMSIEITTQDPPTHLTNQKQGPNAHKQTDYQHFDYASLRNLKNDQNCPVLLPGLRKKGTKLSAPKMNNEIALIKEPKLLTTAKQFIKQIHSLEEESSIEISHQLGMSSFLNSREVTPANPLISTKKRNPSQRNKVNSLASELFSIPSNPQYPQDKASKLKSPQFRLYDTLLGQSEVVYRYVFGKARLVNPKVIHLWKDCLNHEDKSQIFLPVGNEKVEIPYSNARIYPLDKIEKEFKTIFGSGKNRSLTAGEEAIIIESIQKYLKLCSREPLKIGRKDFDILEDILKDCKLNELQGFPLCMKQVESHFKLMATKWKFSGQLNLKDRMVETGILMGKNNFLDLSRQNILTEFLLTYSNISDIS